MKSRWKWLSCVVALAGCAVPVAEDIASSEGELANRHRPGLYRLEIPEAAAGEPPYSTLVQLEIPRAYGAQTCTGTLVAPRYVLTAAHCVYSTADDTFYEGIVVHVAAPYAPWGETRVVDHWVSPRYANSKRWNSEFDLALLQLERPLGSPGIANHRELGCAGRGTYRDSTWYMPGFPSEAPYSGHDVWQWVGTDLRTGTYEVRADVGDGYSLKGMSGSALIRGADGKAYGVFASQSPERLAWARITCDRLRQLRGVMARSAPAGIDLQPLVTRITPAEFVAAETPIESIEFYVHNHGSETFSGTFEAELYTGKVSYESYRRSDELDQLQSIYRFPVTATIAPGESVLVRRSEGLPTFPAGLGTAAIDRAAVRLANVPGDLDTSNDQLALLADGAPILVRREARETVTVSGYVRDRANGVALANFHVVLNGGPDFTTTDENGHFVLEVPRDRGEAAIQPRNSYHNTQRYSFYPERINVPTDRNSDELEFRPGFAVHGLVQSRFTYSPFEDVRVNVDYEHASSAVTDEHGRFTVFVPVGYSGSLRFSHPDFVFPHHELIDVQDSITRAVTIYGAPAPDPLRPPFQPSFNL